ncbi:hypothetical protein D3C72_2518700 [compost metagenome]
MIAAERLEIGAALQADVVEADAAAGTGKDLRLVEAVLGHGEGCLRVLPEDLVDVADLDISHCGDPPCGSCRTLA